MNLRSVRTGEILKKCVWLSMVMIFRVEFVPLVGLMALEINLFLVSVIQSPSIAGTLKSPVSLTSGSPGLVPRKRLVPSCNLVLLTFPAL